MKYFVCIMLGVVWGSYFTAKELKNYIVKIEKKALKSGIVGKILTLSDVQKKRIKYNLEEMQVKKVAIYGCGEGTIFLSKLMEELGIEVCYFIDRNAEFYPREYNVLGIDEEWEYVDIIIVMPIWDYKKIELQLKKRTKTKIISVNDIL